MSLNFFYINKFNNEALYIIPNRKKITYIILYFYYIHVP